MIVHEQSHIFKIVAGPQMVQVYMEYSHYILNSDLFFKIKVHIFRILSYHE